VKTICVIPARYASSRLPGKPLAKIADKPMIQWVYEQANKAKLIDKIIIATDNDEIKKTVEGFGGTAVLTSPQIPSGTDRVYAAIKNEECDVVLNLQGDEPFVMPNLLDDLIKLFQNENVQIATPIKKIEKEEDLFDNNIVKVVKNKKNFALYFSRSPIPFLRDRKVAEPILNNAQFYKHIGIYAYTKTVLTQITKLEESYLEKTEKLEQLRFLENGYNISTLETLYDSIAIDTKDDLANANKLVESKSIDL